MYIHIHIHIHLCLYPYLYTDMRSGGRGRDRARPAGSRSAESLCIHQSIHRYIHTSISLYSLHISIDKCTLKSLCTFAYVYTCICVHRHAERAPMHVVQRDLSAYVYTDTRRERPRTAGSGSVASQGIHASGSSWTKQAEVL